MYFEILQLSFACCKLMNTLTRVSLLSTYIPTQFHFNAFVPRIYKGKPSMKRILTMSRNTYSMYFLGYIQHQFCKHIPNSRVKLQLLVSKLSFSIFETESLELGHCTLTQCNLHCYKYTCWDNIEKW